MDFDGVVEVVAQRDGEGDAVAGSEDLRRIERGEEGQEGLEAGDARAGVAAEG